VKYGEDDHDLKRLSLKKSNNSSFNKATQKQRSSTLSSQNILDVEQGKAIHKY
jgi:hypothetical protein